MPPKSFRLKVTTARRSVRRFSGRGCADVGKVPHEGQGGRGGEGSFRNEKSLRSQLLIHPARPDLYSPDRRKSAESECEHDFRSPHGRSAGQRESEDGVERTTGKHGCRETDNRGTKGRSQIQGSHANLHDHFPKSGNRAEFFIETEGDRDQAENEHQGKPGDSRKAEFEPQSTSKETKEGSGGGVTDKSAKVIDSHRGERRSPSGDAEAAGQKSAHSRAMQARSETGNKQPSQGQGFRIQLAHERES